MKGVLFIIYFQTFFSLYSLRPCGKETLMGEIENVRVVVTAAP
jgi:hypothetical protein